MRQTQLIMDMPVIVEVVNPDGQDIFDTLFDYFHYVDNTFSTFKKTSEITKINTGVLRESEYSPDMKTILRLARQTKKETSGYFDIRHGGKIDPSGVVKGWAIHNAANLLRKAGYTDFYVEAGGDIEVSGNNKNGKTWTIGIRNPYNSREVVKKVALHNLSIATSGTYERGAHIYNPKTHTPVDEIVSLTVIGPNILEADRFATAAFAMGGRGIEFIEHLNGFEGYMIDTNKVATQTHGFGNYVV
jgi:thiamine biosynthesis lipoprotein